VTDFLCLSSSLVGPVLLAALRLLASICLSEVVTCGRVWLLFVVLATFLGSLLLTKIVVRALVGRRLIVRSNGFCSRQGMGLKPKRGRRRQGIYSRFPPPRCFIAMTMQLAMMSPAQRDRELVTGLAAQRPVLRKAQMMPADASPWILTLNASASRTEPARKLLFAQNPRRCGLQL